MYGCPARPRITIMGMTSDDRARTRAEARQLTRDSSAVLITVIVASTVVAVAVVAAAVALSLAGRDLSFIVGIIGPVTAAAALLVAALGKLVAVDRKQDAQSAKLAQVADQTNGALRAHIDRSIRDALDERLGTPTPRKGNRHGTGRPPPPR
jgi:uncharacterized membrane protein